MWDRLLQRFDLRAVIIIPTILNFIYEVLHVLQLFIFANTLRAGGPQTFSMVLRSGNFPGELNVYKSSASNQSKVYKADRTLELS